MRRIKGFTLIELLVVISIIALLMSILAPALSTVKEQARSLVCMTHQKDLTLSWSMYAVANNGKICGSYNYYGNGSGNGEFDDEASWVWAAWSEENNFPVIGNPYSGNPSTWTVTRDQKIAGIKKGSIWPYSDDIDIYRCPSDQNSFDHVRSYVIADNMNGQRPNIDITADWNIYKRIEKIPRPSESYVLTEESDPRPYNMDSFLFFADEGEWRDPLAVWHRGATSFSFADGHVEQRKWNEDTAAHLRAADELNGYEFFLWSWSPDSPGGMDDTDWMEAGWAR